MICIHISFLGVSGPRSDTRPLFFGYFVKFRTQINKKVQKK